MTERIQKISLDERGARRSMEAEHERNVAMADLMGDNVFEPVCMKDGPYDVRLSIEEGRLVLEISSAGGQLARVVLSVAPLRSVIRDYFIICESYYEALKAHNPAKIEAIDMGRRGLHNEGSDLLRDALQGRVELDHDTARRLFTLVCVLHIRG